MTTILPLQAPMLLNLLTALSKQYFFPREIVNIKGKENRVQLHFCRSKRSIQFRISLEAETVTRMPSDFEKPALQKFSRLNQVDMFFFDQITYDINLPHSRLRLHF